MMFTVSSFVYPALVSGKDPVFSPWPLMHATHITSTEIDSDISLTSLPYQNSLFPAS